ncbi:NAD(P)/FAD-dependent oxidoreductase [Candidatus Thorarchaeota archaeon]|nr:MAG: NAD(P)/FAD-dependent oxidoreductase [Candidatus Thorarchaeota archaeon]
MPHDLLIAGTGPAGLMTAERAAEYGLKPLILERRKTVTDSLMGELVTTNALKLLRVKPDSEYIGNKYKAIVGESLDTGAKISVGEGLLGDSYLLDEDRCQELMRDRAEANGAEFRFKSRVNSVVKEGTQVVGVKYNESEEARANLVVGADGSFSRVSGTAGFVHPKWLLSYGIRWKLENCKDIDAGTAYFYVGKDVGLGYLWLYPRSESEVNLGIGRVPSSKENWEKLPPLLDVLKKYKKTLPGLKDSKIAAQNGGVVPCAGLIPRFADAGIALVGNAAGQVSSIVGGGVTTCLHAGTVLAKHAKRAVDENDFSRSSLMKYEKEYRRSKLAWNIQNTGKGFWAISKYARFNDPIEAAEIVLNQLDAKTLNALVQGQAGVSDIMTLLKDFLPMVLTIGKGYLKSIAVSGL